MIEIFAYEGAVSDINSLDFYGLMQYEGLIVKNVIETRLNQCSKSNNWTKLILGNLKQLGRNLGFLVPPFQLGGNIRDEWVYDLVWIEGSPNPSQRVDKDKIRVQWEEIKTIRRLILACESEFGEYEADIAEDFMKLVYCNCDFRLFIYLNRRIRGEIGKVCISGDNSGRIDILEVCRNFCKTPMNQRYLLVGLPEKDCDIFRINCWVV